MINIKMNNDPNVENINSNVEFIYNSKEFDEDILNKFSENTKLYKDLFFIRSLKRKIASKENSDINDILKDLINNLGHTDICGEIISFIYNRLLVEEEVCISNIIEKTIIGDKNEENLNEKPEDIVENIYDKNKEE